MARDTRVVREDDGWVQGAPERSRRQNVPPPPPGKGQAPRRWAYGYPELARLLGKSEGALRQDVRRKRFNPADLRDVVRFYLERSERGRRVV